MVAKADDGMFYDLNGWELTEAQVKALAATMDTPGWRVLEAFAAGQLASGVAMATQYDAPLPVRDGGAAQAQNFGWLATLRECVAQALRAPDEPMPTWQDCLAAALAEKYRASARD